LCIPNSSQFVLWEITCAKDIEGGRATDETGVGGVPGTEEGIVLFLLGFGEGPGNGLGGVALKRLVMLDNGLVETGWLRRGVGCGRNVDRHEGVGHHTQPRIEEASGLCDERGGGGEAGGLGQERATRRSIIGLKSCGLGQERATRRSIIGLKSCGLGQERATRRSIGLKSCGLSPLSWPLLKLGIAVLTPVSHDG